MLVHVRVCLLRDSTSTLGVLPRRIDVVVPKVDGKLGLAPSGGNLSNGMNLPLYVAQFAPFSLAPDRGVEIGDIVEVVCGTIVSTLQDFKDVLARNVSNDVHMTLRRCPVFLARLTLQAASAGVALLPCDDHSHSSSPSMSTSASHHEYSCILDHVTNGGFGLTVDVDANGVLRIASIEPGGEADRAGLQVGDVIIGAAGEGVETLDDYERRSSVAATHGQPLHVVVTIPVDMEGSVPHINSFDTDASDADTTTTTSSLSASTCSSVCPSQSQLDDRARIVRFAGGGFLQVVFYTQDFDRTWDLDESKICRNVEQCHDSSFRAWRNLAADPVEAARFFVPDRLDAADASTEDIAGKNLMDVASVFDEIDSDAGNGGQLVKTAVGDTEIKDAAGADQNTAVTGKLDDAVSTTHAVRQPQTSRHGTAGAGLQSNANDGETTAPARSTVLRLRDAIEAREARAADDVGHGSTALPTTCVPHDGGGVRAMVNEIESRRGDGLNVDGSFVLEIDVVQNNTASTTSELDASDVNVSAVSEIPADDCSADLPAGDTAEPLSTTPLPQGAPDPGEALVCSLVRCAACDEERDSALYSKTQLKLRAEDNARCKSCCKKQLQEQEQGRTNRRDTATTRSTAGPQRPAPVKGNTYTIVCADGSVRSVKVVSVDEKCHTISGTRQVAGTDAPLDTDESTTEEQYPWDAIVWQLKKLKTVVVAGLFLVLGLPQLDSHCHDWFVLDPHSEIDYGSLSANAARASAWRSGNEPLASW